MSLFRYIRIDLPNRVLNIPTFTFLKNYVFKSIHSLHWRHRSGNVGKLDALPKAVNLSAALISSSTGKAASSTPERAVVRSHASSVYKASAQITDSFAVCVGLMRSEHFLISWWLLAIEFQSFYRRRSFCSVILKFVEYREYAASGIFVMVLHECLQCYCSWRAISQEEKLTFGAWNLMFFLAVGGTPSNCISQGS